MAAVVAYRMSPPWLGYAIALAAGVSLVSGAVGGLGASRSIGADVLFAGLVVVGAAGAFAVAACARGFEVRASDAGVMSMGLGTLRMMRWQDVDRFEIDRYRSSPFAVYAVLADGSRVALEPLRGGSSQGARVEQMRHALATKLADEQSRHTEPAQGRAAWPRVPLGWRRRARRVQTRTF